MSNWKPKDLTGNPEVEEQIRQYYNRKRYTNPDIVFVEGAALQERPRAEFTIDNNYMHNIAEEDMELYHKNIEAAWKRYYQADKIRREHEGRQKREYTVS